MWIFGTCGKPTRRGWTNNSYRPLSVITLILDRAATLFLFPSDVEKHRLIFHVTNVALQFINVLLASVLAQSLFKTYTKDLKVAKKLGLACALVFGLHPVRTEVVSNVTSRAEMLAANFVFIALIVYLERCMNSNNNSFFSWFSICTLMTWCGVLCKETALVCPAIILAVEISYNNKVESAVPKTSLQFLQHRLTNMNLTRVSSILVLTFVTLFTRLRLFSCSSGTGYSLDTVDFLHNAVSSVSDPISRYRTAAFIQSKAMSMLFVPLGLSHEHSPIQALESFMDIRMLLVVVMYLLILYASIFVLKTSVRVVAFAFVVAGYLPASHVIMKVAFTLAERTLFLPSFGASCLIVDFVYSTTTRVNGPGLWQRLIMVLVVVHVFFFPLSLSLFEEKYSKAKNTPSNTTGTLPSQFNVTWIGKTKRH